MVVALSELIRSSSGSSVALRFASDENSCYIDQSAVPVKYTQRSGQASSVQLGRTHRLHREQNETDESKSENEEDDDEEPCDDEEDVTGIDETVCVESSNFATVLYDLTSKVDESSILWLPSGSGFEIVDANRFVDSILQQHFQSKISIYKVSYLADICVINGIKNVVSLLPNQLSLLTSLCLTVTNVVPFLVVFASD